jgi:MoxR-like ATPase
MSSELSAIQSQILELKSLISRRIIGQDILIEKLLFVIFGGGHVLLEGVPGLGKTLTVKTIAEVLDLDFQRISFTPDLLPSDLTGSEVYRPQKWEFSVRKGPIFTSILLADEINRTPPKVQSALLEAMEEWGVTIGETTFDLPRPFIVFATQNPIEQSGTYPLPEAELDRFMMKLVLDYPKAEDEIEILRAEASHGKLKTENWKQFGWKMLSIPGVRDAIISGVKVDEKIYAYISIILEATRHPRNGYESIAPLLEYGASTRAGLALVKLARVRAVLEGRDYVLPEDIKNLALDVLRHRIWLSYEAIGKWIKSDEVIQYILDNTLVP